MKKALLVIDMPTSCDDCLLDYDALNGCTVYDSEDHDEVLKQSREKRPALCPLKPVPRLENNEQVYQMMTKHSAMCNVGTSTKFSMLRFIDGWESCLDEIEGK